MNSKVAPGFTLLEMLVTMSLIVVLISLAVPSWGMITRSRARQTATTLVMESLEHARTVAITSKNDVWVVFQHPGGITRDSLRILSRQGSAITPLGPWQPLPSGIFFHSGENLMKEYPPADLLSISLNGANAPSGTLFGSVMFQRAGRVGIPLPGGSPLIVDLSSATAPRHPSSSSITLSRATGRATCQ